jgi:hypothetical protein
MWPSSAHWRHFALLYGLLTILFVVVFGGADWITQQHSVRIHAFWAFELSIPLVPWMVVPYMTMYVVFPLAPFLLRDKRELNRLGLALAQVILVSGVAFLALPAELGFPPAIAPGSVWGPWLRLADRLNLDFDLIPSLHVALFATCAGVYATRVAPWGRALLGLWLALVTASTVLTHQHHLIDAATGLALGAWGTRSALQAADVMSSPRAGSRSWRKLEEMR